MDFLITGASIIENTQCEKNVDWLFNFKRFYSLKSIILIFRNLIAKKGYFMRKKWMVSLIFLVISTVLVACSSNNSEKAGGSKKKELVVVDWGGPGTEAMKEVWYKPFEEKTGIKVISVNPMDYGKVKAMVQSGKMEWDVATAGRDFVVRGEKEGLLEKLDYNVINTDGIDQKYQHDYGIRYMTMGYVISYNTKSFDENNHPHTWADFWDVKKFPGDRTLFKNPQFVLEAALLADGVKPKDIYPLDVDRAFKSLDKIKPYVKTWWESPAQLLQLLSTNEVSAGFGWSGRMISSKSEGAPVDMEMNEGIFDGDYYVVPKGAPNKEAAMEFINFILQPEQQAAFASKLNYAPINEKAMDILSQEEKDRLKITPDLMKNGVEGDMDWWVDNYDKVTERFNEWLLK